MTHRRPRAAALLLPATLAWTLSGPGVAAQEAYESYFRFIGTYPADATPAYAEDAQGLTTDGESWFITQSFHEFDPSHPENALWKFPVSLDLDSISQPGGFVERVLVGDTPLGDQGFVHFGDPSWYRSPGGGEYLIIPTEGPVSPCGDVIAIFDADTLVYLGDFPVCGTQAHAPWAAVDSNGDIYSSNFFEFEGQPVRIERYRVDWDQLDQGDGLTWSHLGHVDLVDEHGAPMPDLHGVQGGVVSPADELLYLGVCGPVSDPCVTQNGGGIWVFHMDGATQWSRIAKSVNGPGVFSYEYDPCDTAGAFSAPEEVEGMTIWDFDDGSAPGIGGQLHVIMLDNDASNDDLHLRHYTNKIFVPGQASNVAAGLDYAWDGSVLRIFAGSYPAPFVATKRVRLEAKTSPVVLGDS